MTSTVNFLAIPNKKTWEVDFVGPLKSFIQETYGASGGSEDHKAALNELNKLRSNIILKADDKHESTLEAIYRYYDQLNVLEGKFPMSENQIRINFKWQDAFDKETFFGGKKTLAICSGAYERICVLFNMAAIQSQVAGVQEFSTDEGLKFAAKLFQQSSGILNHLKSLIPSVIQSDPTPDLRVDTINALAALMIAQAQDCFVKKAINDKMKSQIISKLSMQCAELYGEAYKLLHMESIKQIWPREWLPTVAGKQSGFLATAEFYQSQVHKENKDFGLELARLRKSKEYVSSSEMRSGTQFNFQDMQREIQKAIQEAEKDNDLIYHARVPNYSSLDPISKAAVAKPSPMNPPFSQQFHDLFQKIVPLSVHQAVSAFENRKMVVVNGEIGKMREATQILNSTLASLNLPAALEDLGGSEVPQSLLSKSEEVKAAGGFQAIQSLMIELPQLLQRNKELLDEIDNLLEEERNSDEKLRIKFKERWTRTPSLHLTESILSEASKFRNLITNAINADAVVKERFNKHKEAIQILSKSENELKSSLPSSGQICSLENLPVVSELKALIRELDTLKHGRDSIEEEIKKEAETINMTNVFLSSLMEEGSISEEQISSHHLEKTFGPLKEKVKESLSKQENLLENVRKTNERFSEARSGDKEGKSREDKMKSLASAYDGFKELKENLKEGTKFYNDFTIILVKFQSKVSDFCFARKTEKDELMNDLSSSISKKPATDAPPSVPSYQQQQTENDKNNLVPPRPPPPRIVPRSKPNPYPQASPYPPSNTTPYPLGYAMPYPSYQPSMPPGYFNSPYQNFSNQAYPQPSQPQYPQWHP